MDPRARRVAENEAAFREVNEQARSIATRWLDKWETLTILCECADSSCVEQISIPLTVYEKVRAEGARFIVRPGHEETGFERIVREQRGYNVVEKIGESKLYAEQLDPRDKR